MAQVFVALQLHWSQNSREVPEKQVKNTLKNCLVSQPHMKHQSFKPFLRFIKHFFNCAFPF